jgi:hypothetical protein
MDYRRKSGRSIKLTTHLLLVPTLRLSEDITLTHNFMESAGIILPLRYEMSNLAELSAKACDTPLNIFGIPHGYSTQTSVSQPGIIRTPLGVPREIVEQIF